MESYLEKLKADNPIIGKILREQEKNKWEITQGRQYKTVSNTSASKVSFEEYTSLKSDLICQLGVKY